MFNFKLIAATILVCCATLTLPAQKKTPQPSAAAILENVEKGFEGISDFVTTIEAEVDMERVRVPKMKATMYFKKPDKVHFSSSNFAMLPREGVMLNPAHLRQRYNPELLGVDTIDGKSLYKLQLTPKEPRSRPSQLQVWVDPNTWTIARMESTPYQGRIIHVAFTYSLEANKFWLPSTMQASFELAARDTMSRELNLDIPNPDEQMQRPRPMRSGNITVKYLDYKVNVGLSDDVFEKQEGAAKVK
jgi:outer membrane lipoprotein-sorting protein